MKKYKRRLLNVAVALRDADKNEKLRSKFTMLFYGYAAAPSQDCGTPACALGHYAARRDLQRTFRLDEDGSVTDDYYGALEHFKINEDEWIDLFCVFGCNGAETPIEAAEYIERFAERKWPDNE